MRLSTKGRFAVNALIDIALHEQFGPVSLPELGQRHPISLSYMEQMFSRLRQAGLVASTRGPGGGYTLGRKPDDITVADVVRAVEDPSGPSDAAGADLTGELWERVNARVVEFLSTITLRALVLQQLAKGVKVEPRNPPTRGVFKKPGALSPSSTPPQAPNSVFALGQMLLARGG